jgi:hypothetical protein
MGGTSNNVYVMDKEFAWIPSRLISQEGDKAKVEVPTYENETMMLTDGGAGAKKWEEKTISLKFYPGKSMPMQNLNEDGVLNEVEDMVNLPFLHEVRVFAVEEFRVIMTFGFLCCVFFRVKDPKAH